MADFGKLIAIVKAILEEAKAWAEGSFGQNYATARANYDEAVQLDEALSQAVASLKGVRQHDVQSKAGDRRKLGLVVRRRLGGGTLVERGLPKIVQSWLGVEVLKIKDADSPIAPVVTSLKALSSDTVGSCCFLQADAEKDDCLGRVDTLVEKFSVRLTRGPTRRSAV